jgi:hypothetical protein
MAEKPTLRHDINVTNTNNNNNNKIFIVKPLVIPFNQNFAKGSFVSFAKAYFAKAFEKGFKVGITL